MASWLSALVSDLSASASALLGASSAESPGLGESVSEQRVREYGSWLADVEQLLPLPPRPSPSLLASLRALLLHVRFDVAAVALVQRTRRTLLVLATDGLRALASVEGDARLASALVELLVLACTRPELHVSLYTARDSSTHTAFVRSARLLREVYAAVSARVGGYAAVASASALRVSASAAQPPVLLELMRQYAKTLALAALRLPGVARHMTRALSQVVDRGPPPLSAYLSTEVHVDYDCAPYELSADRAVEDVDTAWQSLHDAAQRRDRRAQADDVDSVRAPGPASAPVEEPPSSEEAQWLQWLGQSDSLLAVLVAGEWLKLVVRLSSLPRLHAHPTLPDAFVCHARSVHVDAAHVAKLPAYAPLRDALLWSLSAQSTRASSLRALTDALTCLVAVDARALNAALRHVLSRTNAFDNAAVSDALTSVHGWVRAASERGALAAGLDVRFLTCALDALLSTEHHQVIGRVLQLLHATAHALAAHARRALLSDWLLRDHFFALFLHWDEVVRNYFQQLLFWRITRVSWRALAQLDERGDVQLSEAQRARYPRGDVEGELMLDRALLGKVRAYVQLVQDGQLPQPRLGAYSARALSEWRWLQSTYAAQQEARYNDWKLTPLALLDARALNRI